MGNQNPYIKEKQTTQWPKGKGLTMQLHITKSNVGFAQESVTSADLGFPMFIIVHV